MLIKTTDELRLYVNANVTLNYEDILPHLKRVEIDIIRNVIGCDQLAAFESYSESSSSGSASGSSSSAYSDARSLILYAEANLAMYLWSLTGGNQVSSTGMQRVEHEHKKTAFQYQENTARETYKNSGYNYLDAGLSMMNDNIGSFPLWSASDEFVQFRGSIIHTVKQFRSVYPIDSYLLFAQLNPLMEAVEDFEIAPVIGRTLFASLRAEVLKTESLDEKLQALLPHVRKAIAYHAVVERMKQPGELTDKGLLFESIEANSGNIKSRQQVSDAQLHMRIAQAQQYALNYTQQLKDFLSENEDDYPDYTEHVGDGDNTLDIDSTDGNNFYA